MSGTAYAITGLALLILYFGSDYLVDFILAFRESKPGRFILWLAAAVALFAIGLATLHGLISN